MWNWERFVHITDMSSSLITSTNTTTVIKMREKTDVTLIEINLGHHLCVCLTVSLWNCWPSASLTKLATLCSYKLMEKDGMGKQLRLRLGRENTFFVSHQQIMAAITCVIVSCLLIAGIGKFHVLQSLFLCLVSLTTCLNVYPWPLNWHL